MLIFGIYTPMSNDEPSPDPGFAPVSIAFTPAKEAEIERRCQAAIIQSKATANSPIRLEAPTPNTGLASSSSAPAVVNIFHPGIEPPGQADSFSAIICG
jgi:hypothetical protein